MNAQLYNLVLTADLNYNVPTIRKTKLTSAFKTIQMRERENKDKKGERKSMDWNEIQTHTQRNIHKANMKLKSLQKEKEKLETKK